MQHKLNNSIGAWTTSDSGVDNNERIINHISNYNYYLMEILMVGKSVTRQTTTYRSWHVGNPKLETLFQIQFMNPYQITQIQQINSVDFFSFSFIVVLWVLLISYSDNYQICDWRFLHVNCQVLLVCAIFFSFHILISHLILSLRYI